MARSCASLPIYDFFLLFANNFHPAAFLYEIGHRTKETLARKPRPKRYQGVEVFVWCIERGQ